MKRIAGQMLGDHVTKRPLLCFQLQPAMPVATCLPTDSAPSVGAGLGRGDSQAGRRPGRVPREPLLDTQSAVGARVRVTEAPRMLHTPHALTGNPNSPGWWCQEVGTRGGDRVTSLVNGMRATPQETRSSKRMQPGVCCPRAVKQLLSHSALPLGLRPPEPHRECAPSNVILPRRAPADGVAFMAALDG